MVKEKLGPSILKKGFKVIPRTTAQVETLDNKPTDASSFDAELFLDWSRDPGAWSASSVMSQEQAAPALAAKEPAVHVVATSGPVAQSPVVEPVMVAPQAPVSIQNTPPTLRAIPADLQPEDRESYLPEPYGGPKPEDPKPQPSSERMPQHASPSYRAQVPPQPMPVPTNAHDPAPATLQPQPHDYSQQGPSSEPKKRQLKFKQVMAGIFGRPHDR